MTFLNVKIISSIKQIVRKRKVKRKMMAKKKMLTLQSQRRVRKSRSRRHFTKHVLSSSGTSHQPSQNRKLRQYVQ